MPAGQPSAPAGPPTELSLDLTRVVRGGGSLIARYAATALLGLVGTTVLLRFTEPAVWAPYSIAYFIVAFAERELGNRVLGSVVHAKPDPSQELLASAAFTMAAIGSLIAAALTSLALIAPLLVDQDGMSICLFAAAGSLLVYLLRALPVVQLEKRLAYGRIALLEVLDQLTFVAVAVPLTVIDPNVAWLALGLAIRGLPSALILRFLSPAPIVGRPHRAQVRRICAYAIPGAGAAAWVLLEGLVPLLVLGDAKELGFVMMAASIAGYPAVVQTIVHRLSFPAFVRLRAGGAGMNWLLARSTQLSVFGLASLVVPLAALAPLWLPALLGPKWADATDVLALIGLGYLCASVMSIVGGALIAESEPRIAYRLIATTASAYLVAAILVPSNAESVALAYAGTRGLGLLLALWLAGRRGWHGLRRPVLTATVLSATLSLLIMTAIDADAWIAAGALACCAATLWLLWLRRMMPTLRAVLAAR